MAQSSRLRAGEIRRAFLLGGECRELGDDPILWRHHWSAQAAALTGADLVMGGELADVATGRPRDLGHFDWGWENGFDRLGWDAALLEFRDHPDLILTPPFRRYLRRVVRHDGVALARTDLMTDRGWYRSWNYRELQSVSAMDHTAWCFRALPNSPDEYGGVLICRAHQRTDFTARDKALLRELVAVITPMIGGPLARFGEPSPASLSPRLRQVLRLLLEGDADKQIAYRLGLSRYTINEYTDKIYRYFSVQSRPELLARWLRRGYGARFAWSDPIGE